MEFVTQNVQSVSFKSRLLGFRVMACMMVRMNFVGRDGLNTVRCVSHVHNWL